MLKKFVRSGTGMDGMRQAQAFAWMAGSGGSWMRENCTSQWLNQGNLQSNSDFQIFSDDLEMILRFFIDVDKVRGKHVITQLVVRIYLEQSQWRFGKRPRFESLTGIC